MLSLTDVFVGPPSYRPPEGSLGPLRRLCLAWVPASSMLCCWLGMQLYEPYCDDPQLQGSEALRWSAVSTLQIQIKAEGLWVAPVIPHHRAMASWPQNTKGLEMPHLLAPGDSGKAWRGQCTHEATVSPQKCLSHMKQWVKNFLFYFYCGICPGKEHLVGGGALWRSLAEDERGSGLGRLTGMLSLGTWPPRSRGRQGIKNLIIARFY